MSDLLKSRGNVIKVILFNALELGDVLCRIWFSVRLDDIVRFNQVLEAREMSSMAQNISWGAWTHPTQFHPGVPALIGT